MYHNCVVDFDSCCDGYHFANLCGELSQLRRVFFAVNLRLQDKPNKDLVLKFTRTFCTPFWLYGPLGRVQVCIGFNSEMNFIQMYSLPYTYPSNAIFRTIDLIDIQFNTETDEKKMSIDLSIALEPLWSNMRRFLSSFAKKQHVPLTFLRALQYRGYKGGELIRFLFF